MHSRHDCELCEEPFLGFCGDPEDERVCRKCAGWDPSLPTCSCVVGLEDSRALCAHHCDPGFIILSFFIFLSNFLLSHSFTAPTHEFVQDGLADGLADVDHADDGLADAHPAGDGLADAHHAACAVCCCGCERSIDPREGASQVRIY